ncbi:hypothetical protein AB9K34_24105 [Sedimentitalea sp. XS_ASV28]|uniref:hypothetical protein n=1 Tax=Sedimentitalea sp. XS_ASV28 TaxID=3241296 RepID=UPI003510E382
MRALIPLCIPLCLAAGQAAAQDPMSAEAFDAYTRGKTLYYGYDGKAYGVERYLDDRRVIWSFLDGKCMQGVWYQKDEQICFVYEDRLDVQCWAFSLGPRGLVARFENSPDETQLYEARENDDEMLCYGPEVGV